ncbi:autophagy-related 10 [Arctopsyche grandis]|uniref:autophagy-related 10 n=1 Tax=Arctopsyche grandis TaxID=121162 RepID=UPI00406D6DFA
MESELSWEQFIKYAEQIEREAITLGDNWKIVGDRTCPGEAYLHHKCVQRSPKTLKPLRWEHHVCYSLCYAVPIIYFNVWNENGTLLPLADVWEFCHPHYKSQVSNEMYTTLTQQEHPILHQPFFAIHPCKTQEFLNGSNQDINILVKFITSVGPMVNLSLNYSYGKL